MILVQTTLLGNVELNLDDSKRCKGLHSRIEKHIKILKKDNGITRLKEEDKCVLYNEIRTELLK